jgi:NAD(P)-dependent dehydrogenase (short-subunit alcohol dehydrogenase family)
MRDNQQASAPEVEANRRTLVGRCALVTGAARRIGRELAITLAWAGASVVVHYRDSEEDAQETVARIADAGGEAWLVRGDLVHHEQTLHLMDDAVAAAGRPLDILVNNASVFESLSLMTTSVEDWDRNLAVNLRAPALLARGLARQLPRDAVGDVINLNDDRIFRPGADNFPYTVSKVGLHGLTLSLALALAPRIRVNELALGAILPPAMEDSAREHTMRGAIPTERFDTAREVAHAMLFLLENPAVTGQTVCVNGGRHLI